MSGKIVILVAPSGAGKSTILKRIVEERADLQVTVTYTTRAMRAGESEGNPYHFVDSDKFQELIDQDFFVEWAEVHKKRYGTPIHQIEEIWGSKKHVIMDADVQGAKTLKSKFPDALTVFILPPSIDELKRRVTERDGGAPKDLELRMANAEKEIALAESFDVRIVNENIESAYQEFKKIIEEYFKAP